MNVLLVSECNNNALPQTRRILDQFAERRGQRTWQTAITRDGLKTLHKLLRRSARRNTAVSCHWVRRANHSELLWIVGDASRFNLQGAVPTNITNRNILRGHDENDWLTGEDIRLLACLAALMHDLGKACVAFQKRLRNPALKERNIYRHEWTSLRLFQNFVGTDPDEEWLKRLAGPHAKTDWLQNLIRDGIDNNAKPPFRGFTDEQPLAQAVAWLVVTHHRLPTLPSDKAKLHHKSISSLLKGVSALWNENNPQVDAKAIKPYWEFKKTFPTESQCWQRQASATAEQALQRNGFLAADWLADRYSLHLARLCLMLADHHYSSLSDPRLRVRGDKNYPLYANTFWSSSGERELNQPLDEHIVGVAKHTRKLARSLPRIFNSLPRLANHKGFRRRAGHPRFRWQDKAFDLCEGLREVSESQGFFGINMASTGRGKTLANARIMYALANPQRGARFTVALGLRTLTLQTGEAYRQKLDLGEDVLAVRVGGSANRELFEHYQQERWTGSESADDLLDDNSYVHFDGQFDDDLLQALARKPREKALLAAPLVVCTIDHLVPATESLRGGGQIAPMLRLLTSDLVLDEPDDFDLDDLPAVARLVNWAGLLGSRVLLSSATLPPAIVQALFEAYRDGRAAYQAARGQPGRALEIPCAWFDEHERSTSHHADLEGFKQAHAAFATRRADALRQHTPRQLGRIESLATDKCEPDTAHAAMARRVLDLLPELHQQHGATDSRTGKTVSFGLLRMANIDPLAQVAEALLETGAPEQFRLHVCVYHARHPLLIRSRIERQLDVCLNRHDPGAVFALPDIRARLSQGDEPNQVFLVLASPVAEVGRDHDYDWAIVEPSSLRSIIQLAGRVRRHRHEEVTAPNIILLSRNLRSIKHPGQPAFCWPGFESEQLPLASHNLSDLLDETDYQRITSLPRIIERQPLQPTKRLVDLEHTRLHMRLTGETEHGDFCANHWWRQNQAPLTGALQGKHPFRKSTGKELDLRLMPDEDGEDWQLEILERDGTTRSADRMVKHEDELTLGPRMSIWADEDYLSALHELSEELDLPLTFAAAKFGTVRLRELEETDENQLWRYHPVLGFRRAKHGE